ncbi:hypothetical protein BC826DRAFT_95508 [Russula brevipes]|nr:hypothetical protein BC826DRAFT_95508 [Russula brevipes]
MSFLSARSTPPPIPQCRRPQNSSKVIRIHIFIQATHVAPPPHLHRRRHLLPAFLNAALPASQFVKTSQTHQQAPTPFPTPLSPTTARRATTPGRLATPHTPLAQQGPASFPTPTPLQPQGVQQRPPARPHPTPLSHGHDAIPHPRALTTARCATMPA